MDYQSTDEVEKRKYGKQLKQNDSNDILQECYRAIDDEINALSRGRITQALRCQKEIKQYRQQLDDINKKEIRDYKRGKLAELEITREKLEEKIKAWKSDMKGMFKIKHTRAREDVVDMVGNLEKGKQPLEKQTGEEELV